MSIATMYLATKDPDAFDKAVEYRNSHGFGPFVWTSLVEKYKCDSWVLGEGLTQLIEKCNAKELQSHEAFTLVASLGFSYALRDDLLPLADVFDEFVKEFGNERHVCHLGAMAKTMREAHEKGWHAVGWYESSLNADRWQNGYDTLYAIPEAAKLGAIHVCCAKNAEPAQEQADASAP
jgi:hypothetical protein